MSIIELRERDALRKRIARAKEHEVLSNTEILANKYRGQALREKYAEYLQEYYWEDFFTITFRTARKEPYYAAKSVWSELVKYNVKKAFIAVEPFQSGDLHVHGIMSGNIRGWFPEMALPWEIWGGVFKRFGRSKIEACNSPEAVTLYCTKYLLKQQSRVCDYYYLMGDKFAWDNSRIN